MTIDDAKRFLMEQTTRAWLRLKSEPFPKCKFRSQTRRERIIRLRARNMGTIPYRPGEWMGRRLTRSERSLFLAALRELDGGPLNVKRGLRGHVLSLQLTFVRTEAEQ